MRLRFTRRRRLTTKRRLCLSGKKRYDRQLVCAGGCEHLNSTAIVRVKLGLKFAISVGLLAIIWAVFGQTLGHQFVNYDDPLYVTENAHIRTGLNWQNLSWAFTHVHSQNWHPLTSISHMLDCQLFGLQPWWPHLVNVLFHSVTAVLVFQ